MSARASNDHFNREQQSGAGARPLRVARISATETTGSGLEIEWSDGLKVFLPGRKLRLNCPCATCQEQRGDASHSKPLGGRQSLLKVVKADVEESVGLEQVWSVGNYAIGLRWKDGHDTGIYPFPLLYELSSDVPSQATSGE